MWALYAWLSLMAAGIAGAGAGAGAAIASAGAIPYFSFYDFWLDPAYNFNFTQAHGYSKDQPHPAAPG